MTEQWSILWGGKWVLGLEQKTVPGPLAVTIPQRVICRKRAKMVPVIPSRRPCPCCGGKPPKILGWHRTNFYRSWKIWIGYHFKRNNLENSINFGNQWRRVVSTRAREKRSKNIIMAVSMTSLLFLRRNNLGSDLSSFALSVSNTEFWCHTACPQNKNARKTRGFETKTKLSQNGCGVKKNDKTNFLGLRPA